MARSAYHYFELAMAHLPGWMFLVAGMTLLTTTLILPAHLAKQQLDWELSYMQAQADTLDQQATDYQHFLDAVQSDDPVVLERLAFHHLRLKPVGYATLADLATRRGGSATRMVSLGGTSLGIASSTGSAWNELTQRDPSIAMIENWLHRPLPVVGVDFAPYVPPQTRLVRLTTGKAQLWMLAAGVFCLAVGLTPPSFDRRYVPEESC